MATIIINTREKLIRLNYKRYAEVKQVMKELLNKYGEVSVYRTRRGEWGEWFENWKLNGKGKPYIEKEGWM
jgi:hypothetical protein